MRPYFLHMMKMALLCMVQQVCFAQDSTNIAQLSPKYFDRVSQSADGISRNIEKKNERVLRSLDRIEQKLIRTLRKKDSLSSAKIESVIQQRRNSFKEKISSPTHLQQYIPMLDTLKTSLKFLNKNKQFLERNLESQNKIDGATAKLDELQDQFAKTEAIKQFLKEQRQYLNDQFERLGFTKQLNRLNKSAYYYAQQIEEYITILKDPKKLERRAIDLLSRTKLFQSFMQKNSMLAALFHLPSDDPDNPAYLQNLAGLQTRSQLNQLIGNRIGVGGADALQQIQNNVSQARNELQQLRNKVDQYGANASDGKLPEFKPNNQRTKSFLKRIEIGTIFQSQRGNSLLPLTSDLGLSAGFRMNDNSIIGLGASYKMGWGKDIKHIRISHQGVGLRSFITAKWKRSLWLTGGYELNYMSAFNKIDELKNYHALQQSGLIGLSKKFSVATKIFKNTNLQLLWDFLSYEQRPRTQPIIFRAGYNF